MCVSIGGLPLYEDFLWRSVRLCTCVWVQYRSNNSLPEYILGEKGGCNLETYISIAP